MCLGSARKINSTLNVPMSLIVLWVGLAPRADRDVAPVMTQPWEAAQLWMGLGGWGSTPPPGPSEQCEIGQHPGVRRGSDVSLWRKEV